MPYAAAISTVIGSRRAAAEVAACAAGLGGPPDLATVFFSPHHHENALDIVDELATRLKARAMIGCLGEGIVGPGHEAENEPAISLWLANFGGQIEVEPFHLQPTDTPDGLSLLGWPDALDECEPANAAVLTFGDPYTFPLVELFFPRVHEDYPGLPVVGGMSSGSSGPGQTLLVHQNEVVTFGAVGVLLRGPALWRTVVSQGCRPIGRPLVITRGRDTIIQEVGGQPPLAYLQELFPTLSPSDQNLMQQALHVGIAMSEYKDHFDRGDFVIRNLTGIDKASGAIHITDRVRIGATIQFQVRDAATADEDFRTLLKKEKKASSALLFTCNGRGSRLFSTPHHDAAAISDAFGPLPTAGFFAAGEFGPVGGVNYIHGFTASVVLFE
jgi:small ligand-binding sensory domain FIST